MDYIAKLLGEWSSNLTVGSVFLRFAIALIFSAIIGCERATKRHAAGLRTFMIVALASTTAGLIDCFLSTLSFPAVSAATVVAIAIVSSNTILYSSKNQIKGLTTSMGLWGCSLLGIATGVGYYTVAIIGFLALVFCLGFFPKFEVYLKNRSNHFEVHLELTNKNSLGEFVTTIRKLGLRIDDIEANPAYANSGLSVFSVSMTIDSPELKKYKTHKEIIAAIGSLDYVYYIEEMN